MSRWAKRETKTRGLSWTGTKPQRKELYSEGSDRRRSDTSRGDRRRTKASVLMEPGPEPVPRAWPRLNLLCSLLCDAAAATVRLQLLVFLCHIIFAVTVATLSQSSSILAQKHVN